MNFVFLSLVNAFSTSSSAAPFFTSTLSGVGSKWSTLVLLRLTPVTDLGPVIRTKFLSTTSTITHFLPVSRPTSFTQIRPTSILGIMIHRVLFAAVDSRAINKGSPSVEVCSSCFLGEKISHFFDSKGLRLFNRVRAGVYLNIVNA